MLLSGKKQAANPALDATVKKVMADIGKLEAQIAKLEDTKAAAKPAPKRKKA